MVAAYLAELLESHRTRLLGTAYRLTGGVTAAEDAVQECLLRLNGVHQSEIDDLGEWLTATVTRICAEHLVAAHRSPGAHRLPDPLVTPLVSAASTDPWADIGRRAENRLPNLVALASLTPAQRLAAVLPALPAALIAEWLELDEAAAERAALAGRSAAAALPGPVTAAAHDAAVRRLLTAVRARSRAAVCEGGDRGGDDPGEVARGLHPDVQALSVTGAGPVVVDGPERVAGRLLALAAGHGLGRGDDDPDGDYEFASVNGELGLVLRGAEMRRVLGFTVRDDAVWRVFDLAGPARGW